jgi:Bacterial Ig-like domain
MKKVKLILSSFLAMAIIVTVLNSCGNDDDPAAITLSSLTANAIDLNGATSPTNVPTDAVIVATFTTDVDAATATEANITLTRDYDDAVLPINISASGPTITITPEEDLGGGTLYILSVQGLASQDGASLGSAVERNFTTAGTFSPAGVVAHFTFEDNANDIVGTYDPTESDIVDLTFAASRKTAAGKAASFNGTTTIVEVPNADDFLENDDFAVSFWVKADASEPGHFVLGLAGSYGFQFEIAGDYAWVKMAMQYDQGDGTKASEDSFWNGDGQTKDTNPAGWQGWTFNKDVTASGGVGDTYFKDKWAHVVVTYNAATQVNTMYVNGEKVKEHDFEFWPDVDKKKNITGTAYAGNAAPGNELAFGFIQARESRAIEGDWADYASEGADKHFKGLLDDFRVFNHSLTATEVSLMYNSEKP